MTLLDAEIRTRKRNARLLLEAELPECLRATKRPFEAQRGLWIRGMKYVDAWARQPRSAGLLLQGGVGRGKSELAALLLFMLADLHGQASLYLNAKALSYELRDSYKPDKPDARSEWQILQAAETRDVVCLDDIGGEGGANEALHLKSLTRALIDHGAASNKLTIMVVNLGDESLSALLNDERTTSRYASWERLVFEDSIPDYRKRR